MSSLFNQYNNINNSINIFDDDKINENNKTNWENVNKENINYSKNVFTRNLKDMCHSSINSDYNMKYKSLNDEYNTRLEDIFNLIQLIPKKIENDNIFLSLQKLPSGYFIERFIEIINNTLRDEKERKIIKLIESISNLRVEIESKNNKINEMLDEIKNKNENKEKENKNYLEEIKVKSEHINMLIKENSDLNKLNNKINLDYKNDIQAISNDFLLNIRELKCNITSLKDENEILKQRNSIFEQRNRDNEEELSNLKIEIHKLKEKNIYLESEKKENKTLINSICMENKNLKGQLKNIQEEFHSINYKNTLEEAENKRLKEFVSFYENERDDLFKNYNKFNENIISNPAIEVKTSQFELNEDKIKLKSIQSNNGIDNKIKFRNLENNDDFNLHNEIKFKAMNEYKEGLLIISQKINKIKKENDIMKSHIFESIKLNKDYFNNIFSEFFTRIIKFLSNLRDKENQKIKHDNNDNNNEIFKKMDHIIIEQNKKIINLQKENKIFLEKILNFEKKEKNYNNDIINFERVISDLKLINGNMKSNIISLEEEIKLVNLSNNQTEESFIKTVEKDFERIKVLYEDKINHLQKEIHYLRSSSSNN